MNAWHGIGQLRRGLLLRDMLHFGCDRRSLVYIYTLFFSSSLYPPSFELGYLWRSSKILSMLFLFFRFLLLFLCGRRRLSPKGNCNYRGYNRSLRRDGCT